MAILSNAEIMQKLNEACRKCGALGAKARAHQAIVTAVEPDHTRAPRDIVPGPALTRVPPQR